LGTTGGALERCASQWFLKDCCTIVKKGGSEYRNICHISPSPQELYSNSLCDDLITILAKVATGIDVHRLGVILKYIHQIKSMVSMILESPHSILQGRIASSSIDIRPASRKKYILFL
jgi:hypothetical protein